MTLYRYIWGQLLWPVILIFFSLNLLFLLVQLLKVGELTFGAGLGLGDLLRVAVLFLPGFAVFTIPISVLTGVLLGFGRMAADNEMVALSAAGVSTFRVVAVPLFLGLAATFISGLVTNSLAPISADELKQMFIRLTRQHVVASLAPGRFYEDIPKVVLYPRQPGSALGSWDGFMMFDCRSEGSCYAMVARQASIVARADRNALDFSFEEGEVHSASSKDDGYTVGSFVHGTVGMDIDRLVSVRTRFIPEVERMSLTALEQGANDEKTPERERRIMKTAWHRRFAFPLSSLLFALLGAVLTASGKLRGWRGTLVAAVSMIAAFYLLMRLGDAMVQAKIIVPAMAAWMPDILVLMVILIRVLKLERKAF